MHAKSLLETRQKVRVSVPTAIGNDATRDSVRIDLNKTSLRSGLLPGRLPVSGGGPVRFQQSALINRASPTRALGDTPNERGRQLRRPLRSSC